MSGKQAYFVMLGIIVLLFAALFGGAYGVNSLLQSKAKKLNDVKALSEALGNQQLGLSGAKKQVATYSSLNNIAKTVVPQDKDQAAAVREIANIATASGIKRLSSVSFPASTLGGVGSSTSTSTSTTTTPQSGSKKGGLTQLTPVPGIPGVYQLQITINQTSDERVSYSQFYDFLSRLEQNRRTAQVTNVSVQPDTTNPNLVAFTLIINEFIKP